MIQKKDALPARPFEHLSISLSDFHLGRHVRVRHHQWTGLRVSPDELAARGALLVFRSEPGPADVQPQDFFLAQSEAMVVQSEFPGVAAESELRGVVRPEESPWELPAADALETVRDVAVRPGGLHSVRWEPVGVVQPESRVSELPVADERV